jgi:hypothetical protein
MSTSLARVVREVTEAEPETEEDREAIELANASIVAAALGLGIYIETLV